MRLLLDENMSKTIVQELRDRGHDVLAAKESMRGSNDPSILARAQLESRLVITQDKDFGELAFRHGFSGECGIILFRLTGANREIDNRRILQVIESRQDWSGEFTVVTDDRVRMRPLPKSP